MEHQLGKVDALEAAADDANAGEEPRVAQT